MASPSAVSIMQKPAQLAAISTTFTLFKRSADSTLPVTVYLPGSGRLHGKSFKVRASGTVTTAGSYTALITLQYGVSATTASNTTIEASSARTVGTTTDNWVIEVICTVDDTSGELNGYGWSMIANTRDADAALDNQPTSVDTDAEGNGFVVGVTFGTNNASNVADLKDFSLEVL